MSEEQTNAPEGIEVVDVASAPEPPPPPRIEDLLSPGELAAVHAARRQAVVDAGKAGARHGVREVVGLLALHGFTATEDGVALRIRIEPHAMRAAANTVALSLMARGVKFGPLDSDGPRIEGRYDVMEEAAWLLVSGVDDTTIAAG